MQRWHQTAPSNIALIKYMGKLEQNRPTNRSLSYTLNHLQTHVELELSDAGQDSWAPLTGFAELNLSAKGQTRFLAHLERIKNLFGLKQSFVVRSGNDFPSDCGLASSASSFAALTKCAFVAIHDLQNQSLDLADAKVLKQMSEVSRQGSGSSCRSFFSPLALWSDEGAERVDLPCDNWLHQVVVVDSSVKSVSSSDAHKRVTSSALFNGRVERAEERLEELVQALASGKWQQAFEITWAEFWDMHALFETSKPSFGYMTPGSLDVLGQARKLWQEQGDGPLVTMDAGANVHFLYRSDQTALAETLKSRLGIYRVIEGGPA